MQDVVAVLAGCALGGMGRYWLSGVVGRAVGETFPWGTLTVNVTGAFTIGVVSAHAASGATSATFWSFAVIGFLGSYTTVSSFSLQTLALLREREWERACLNLSLSLALCLGAAIAGMAAYPWLVAAL
jgi:CrcB protein